MHTSKDFALWLSTFWKSTSFDSVDIQNPANETWL